MKPEMKQQLWLESQIEKLYPRCWWENNDEATEQYATAPFHQIIVETGGDIADSIKLNDAMLSTEQVEHHNVMSNNVHVSIEEASDLPIPQIARSFVRIFGRAAFMSQLEAAYRTGRKLGKYNFELIKE